MDTTNLPISIEKVAKSRLSEVDFSKLKLLGQNLLCHMFICDYKNGQWQDARIVAFMGLSLWNLPLVIFHLWTDYFRRDEGLQR